VKRAACILLLALGLAACSSETPREGGAATARDSATTGIPLHYRRAYPVALPVTFAPYTVNAAAGVAAGSAVAATSAGATTDSPPTYGAVPPPEPAATNSAPHDVPPSFAPALTNTAPFVAPSAGPPIPTLPSYDSSQVAVVDTSFGRIVIELDDFAAPRTCANFRQLVSKAFYNGTIFHRVIPQFIIQGGDPESRGGDRSRYGQGDPGYSLPPEIKLHHDRGAVAMARLPDSVNPQRYSNGSQFYICVAPCPSLDDQYTVFGHVIAGMDVADRISIQPADRRNDPLERITMNVTLEPRDRALSENAATGP